MTAAIARPESCVSRRGPTLCADGRRARERNGPMLTRRLTRTSMIPSRLAARAAACAVVLTAWAGAPGMVPVARAQGGVWTTVPVPGAAVYGVADGDSGTVLIAGGNGAFRFDGFRLRR